MADSITLDLLAAQQQCVRAELATMRSQFALMQDNIRVLTVTAIRQETATRNALDLLHRARDRVARLEGATRAI